MRRPMPGRRSLTTAGRPSGSTQACTWLSTRRTAARRRTPVNSSRPAAPDLGDHPGAAYSAGNGGMSSRQRSPCGAQRVREHSGGGRHQLAQLHERRPEPAERGDRALRQRRVHLGRCDCLGTRSGRASQPGAGSVQRLGECQRSPASSSTRSAPRTPPRSGPARPGRSGPGAAGTRVNAPGGGPSSERPGEPIGHGAVHRRLARSPARPRGAGVGRGGARAGMSSSGGSPPARRVARSRSARR